MDHVVYVDAKAKEMDKLINGEKTMIIIDKSDYGNMDDWLPVGDI